jgi:hypothetical protein
VSGRDLFDVLDEAGIDADDPQWDGMDPFDIAEKLGLTADEEDES